MGLFGLTNPFDEEIEKATSESNIDENWARILSVCDRILVTENGCRDGLRAIQKRLNNSNQRIALQAVVLLDAAVKNCGVQFRDLVCSPECTSVIEKKCSTLGPVSERMRAAMAHWVIDYKDDMKLVHALYYKLAAKGIVFPDVAGDTARKQERTAAAADPNVAGNQQEADDLAKAIEESLRSQENESAKPSPIHGASMAPVSTVQNLYSLDALTAAPERVQESVQTAPPQKEAKALYDFEAVEENEVSFKSGHIILLLDTGHEAWWRGRNTATLREGLFPANFVEIIHPSQKLVVAVASEGEIIKEDEAVESVQTLIVPLDLERVEETLMKLRVHDPGCQEGDALKFNEKLCTQMTDVISQKVTLLDKKFGEISTLNERLRDIMSRFQSQDARSMNGYGMQYGQVPHHHQMQGQIGMPQQQQIPGHGVPQPGQPQGHDAQRGMMAAPGQMPPSGYMQQMPLQQQFHPQQTPQINHYPQMNQPNSQHPQPPADQYPQ